MKHKLLIVALLFYVISLGLFAQRVNEHGLKMVSEVEYTTNHGSRVDIDELFCPYRMASVSK